MIAHHAQQAHPGPITARGYFESTTSKPTLGAMLAATTPRVFRKAMFGGRLGSRRIPWRAAFQGAGRFVFLRLSNVGGVTARISRIGVLEASICYWGSIPDCVGRSHSRPEGDAPSVYSSMHWEGKRAPEGIKGAVWESYARNDCSNGRERWNASRQVSRLSTSGSSRWTLDPLGVFRALLRASRVPSGRPDDFDFKTLLEQLFE
ncbi:hypothetical protein CMEL01_12212 [Colletotrichum melonis]|uniref:Uncharacterized protein n=1 Tax=Colletotrichum melonis TaxID=1209925 RepID=A0AAI9UXG4_9PEZI|nr:hypothetical protein CMEL01_12212 [Colletotrichum melonis]